MIRLWYNVTYTSDAESPISQQNSISTNSANSDSMEIIENVYIFHLFRLKFSTANTGKPVRSTCQILWYPMISRQGSCIWFQKDWAHQIMKFWCFHDGVIKWKHFPLYWPFVQGIHQFPGEFPSQRPVTQSFDTFFHLHLNKRLIK